MKICVCSKSKYHFPESVSDSILDFKEASLLLSSLKGAVCPIYILIDPDCFSHEQLLELKEHYPSLPIAVLTPQITPKSYETICLLAPFRLIDPSVLPLNDFAILSELNASARSIRLDSLRQGLRMALLFKTTDKIRAGKMCLPYSLRRVPFSLLTSFLWMPMST